MKRLVLILATAALALIPASPAGASFGFKETDVIFSNEDGSAAIQAGVHPFALTTKLAFNTKEEPTLGYEIPDEDLKDLEINVVPGLVAAPEATPRCPSVVFLDPSKACPLNTVVGINDLSLLNPSEPVEHARIYNLVPPPGVLARIGFKAGAGGTAPVAVELGLSPNPPYNGIVPIANAPQVIPVYRSDATIWGVPADPHHDAARGGEVKAPETPFLTAPRACQGPLPTFFKADSWQHPGVFAEPPPALTHDDATPPHPLGFTGCEKLAFEPELSIQASSEAASSPTGLDTSLNVSDPGLANPKGLAASDIRKTVVTLPEGMTANPSLAAGLEVCSEAQLAQETVDSAPGAGCPQASKIGTVEAESPLVEESVDGAIYVAKPYENEFGSLIALYFVIKNSNLGVIIKQAVEVEPDPQTGQLIAIADDMPQLPISHIRVHMREGARAPLISPPGCGPHAATAQFFPWAGGAPVPSTSTFQIFTGPGEGHCPGAGPLPFHPGFEAGAISNAAGHYSPFNMRLTRRDGEQDMTKFSAVLPPGVLGKIAGLTQCPEAAIAQAKSRTGLHGGSEELAHPSCPESSRIGRTLAGAGVGSQLIYVPGSLYLAGPVGSNFLSVVAIVPALAGPFDAGTVVVRVALQINPVTGQVEADGAHSDPIPHILKGIPLNVRDLRVYTDRPEFTFNATNCEPSQTRATLFGSFLKPLDPSDDVPTELSARYQAADCASLGFQPKLAIKLTGGTQRGAHPALKAVLTPRPKDANFASVVVRLPHSAFLDQAHIRTICTRVQFAAGGGNGERCPAGSRYGFAKAWTPILDEPAEGPVFLRSSNHNLPDFVVALKGPPSAAAHVNVAARIDSVNGGIRTHFEEVPDFPVSRFIFTMQGGKKGLIVNSTNLCHGTNRANANFVGQNGRRLSIKPVVQATTCGKQRR